MTLIRDKVTLVRKLEEIVDVQSPTVSSNYSLPSTGISAGTKYTILNNGTAALNLQSFSGGSLGSINPLQVVKFFALQDSPTLPAHWFKDVSSSSSTANLRPSEGAGTLILTSSDARHQVFNLTAGKVIQLPSSGIGAGDFFIIEGRTNFDADLYASNGVYIAPANGSNLEGTVRKGTVRVVALQDTPTTPAHWHVMDLNDSGSISIAGGTNSGSGTVKYTRSQNKVTLEFTISHSSAASTTFPAATLPTRLRPIVAFANNIWIMSGNPQYIDRVEAASDGVISLSHLLVQTSPGGSNQTGFTGFITYFVTN